MGVGSIARADDDNGRAFGGDIGVGVAQLRGVFTAEQSTKVPQEGDDGRALAPVVAHSAGCPGRIGEPHIAQYRHVHAGHVTGAYGAVMERRLIDDDPVALFELSRAEGWGDGLPLLPPTPSRVAELVQAASFDADHVIAELPPNNRIFTVELAAANAAMAGVEPAAFAHMLAALRAMSDPRHNLAGLTTTTSSVVSAVIVNGPRRAPLGFDFQAGCMGGGGGRGSTTVGRAIQLCLRNVGGQRAGVTSKTVFGQPARIAGLCFGEWEERSPWPSLAVQRGFDSNEDVVSVHGAKGTLPMADGNTVASVDLLALIAKSLAFPLSNMFHGHPERGEAVIVINPMWAERFGRDFPDIADVQAVLLEHAWQPIDTWPQVTRDALATRAHIDARGRVYLAAKPEQFIVVVAGGLGNLHAVALPSWGDSRVISERVAD